MQDTNLIWVRQSHLGFPISPTPPFFSNPSCYYQRFLTAPQENTVSRAIKSISGPPFNQVRQSWNHQLRVHEYPAAPLNLGETKPPVLDNRLSKKRYNQYYRRPFSSFPLSTSCLTCSLEIGKYSSSWTIVKTSLAKRSGHSIVSNLAALVFDNPLAKWTYFFRRVDQHKKWRETLVSSIMIAFFSSPNCRMNSEFIMETNIVIRFQWAQCFCFPRKNEKRN